MTWKIKTVAWCAAIVLVVPMVVVIYGSLGFVMLKSTDALMWLTGWPVWYAAPAVGMPMCAAVWKWWPIRDGGWNPPWKRQRKGLDHG